MIDVNTQPNPVYVQELFAAMQIEAAKMLEVKRMQTAGESPAQESMAGGKTTKVI